MVAVKNDQAARKKQIISFAQVSIFMPQKARVSSFVLIQRELDPGYVFPSEVLTKWVKGMIRSLVVQHSPII